MARSFKLADAWVVARWDNRELNTGLKHTRESLKGMSSDVKGFWVEDAHGKRVAIVSAETRGLSVVLKLEAAVDAPAKLWYGRGCNPITNLHDNLFAAPVFGPMTV